VRHRFRAEHRGTEGKHQGEAEEEHQCEVQVSCGAPKNRGGAPRQDQRGAPMRGAGFVRNTKEPRGKHRGKADEEHQCRSTAEAEEEIKQEHRQGRGTRPRTTSTEERGSPRRRNESKAETPIRHDGSNEKSHERKKDGVSKRQNELKDSVHAHLSLMLFGSSSSMETSKKR
jgi:hypothetical protein